jgi:hypothetical protein
MLIDLVSAVNGVSLDDAFGQRSTSLPISPA